MDSPGVILLIDAGNTRVKFGWAHAGSARREPGALALAHAELDRLAPWLAALPLPPAAALGVNVAGDVIAQRIAAAITRHGEPSVQWVCSGPAAAGVVNSYEVPGQLGADRWVSLIGLAGHTDDAAVLASFGTATTVDTLGPPVPGPDGAGLRRFEGGIILPGPELMRQSLARGTAGLPYAEGMSVPLPRNTHAAIGTGIAAAQAGAVLRQWRAAAEALGAVPRLYCTGGGWPLVATEVSAVLARAQADLGWPAVAPRWLDAPVLDGLAGLAAQRGSRT